MDKGVELVSGGSVINPVEFSDCYVDEMQPRVEERSVVFPCAGKGGTCHMAKQPEFIRRGVESEWVSKNRREGDWDCPNCGNMNYARRDDCNKCQVTTAALFNVKITKF